MEEPCSVGSVVELEDGRSLIDMILCKILLQDLNWDIIFHISLWLHLVQTNSVFPYRENTFEVSAPSRIHK